tara:strand:- start:358 stop:558 length:201 start_codon:yes stop_codon:yes gene_type:complete
MNFFAIVFLLLVVTAINLYFGLNCVNPNGTGFLSKMKKNLISLLQKVGLFKDETQDESESSSKKKR